MSPLRFGACSLLDCPLLWTGGGLGATQAPHPFTAPWAWSTGWHQLWHQLVDWLASAGIEPVTSPSCCSQRGAGRRGAAHTS